MFVICPDTGQIVKFLDVHADCTRTRVFLLSVPYSFWLFFPYKSWHPSGEIVVYLTISEIVYQQIALDKSGGLEITKMVEE